MRCVGERGAAPEVVASYERTFAELMSAALPVLESRAKLEEMRGNL